MWILDIFLILISFYFAHNLRKVNNKNTELHKSNRHLDDVNATLKFELESAKIWLNDSKSSLVLCNARLVMLKTQDK